MATESRKTHGLFSPSKFDVEHALNIYADSYVTFDARLLYEEEFLEHIREGSRAFHIYLIGFTPRVELEIPKFEDGHLCMTASYLGKKVDMRFDVPSDFKFIQSADCCHFVDGKGEKRWIDSQEIMRNLSVAVGGCPFFVKYIGQSYGKDGSRNALDRLLEHETLQKISIKGVPDGFMLQVILLELHSDNRIITVFLPGAKTRDDDGVRRRMGLDKLYGTTEAERVSLYEASLIRYFAPEYNKEFKNSFPSTNLKVLQDCYRKDFLAVIAEICIDPFPFYLHSERVEKKYYHTITHDLQGDSERRAFFAMDGGDLPGRK